MKYATLTLLCCCALLTACDNAGKTDAGAGAGVDQAASAAGDTAATSESLVETAAGELDSAVESAKEAADELAASAQEQADAAADAAQDLAATAVDKSAEVVAEVTSTDSGKGESIYKSSCFACHGTGAAGAPKLDDKAAWEPRIAQGNAVLSQHAIEGFKGATGYMPPKGGYSHLSDADVNLAVDYMVSQAR